MHSFVSSILCYAHYISYGKFLLCKAVNSYWLFRAPVLCNKLPHLSNPTAFMQWDYSAYLKINIYFANEKVVLWWGMESTTSLSSPQTKVLPYKRVHQASYTCMLNG